MESDGDHFLAYYLTQTDEAAASFKSSRSDPLKAAPTDSNALGFLDSDDKRESGAESDLNVTAFHFVRDYETIKIEQDVPNEFLLVLDDGGDDGVKLDDLKLDAESAGQGGVGGKEKRGKGAYYKNIERKMILKKKRVNVRPFSGFSSIKIMLTGFNNLSRRTKRTSTSGKLSS